MADFAAIRFQPSRPLLRELSADRLNSILAEIRRNKPLPGRGITVRQTGQGTAIDLAASVVPRGGGTSTPTTRPFQLSLVNVSETETPEWKVRVLPSTLAGGSSTDLGFSLADDPPYLLDANVGVLQGGLTIDNTGTITSRWLEIVEELSEDTPTDFHVEIGTVAYDAETETWSVENSRYGPIDANVCRDWFSDPPTYSVTFFAVSPY
jgi:hypothetical protein